MKTLLTSILFFWFLTGSSQSIGIGTNTPDSSAQLDVFSTTKGFLPPRMTNTQRNAIVKPAEGLIIFCTDCIGDGKLQVFVNGKWAGLMTVSNNPNLQNTISLISSASGWSNVQNYWKNVSFQFATADTTLIQYLEVETDNSDSYLWNNSKRRTIKPNDLINGTKTISWYSWPYQSPGKVDFRFTWHFRDGTEYVMPIITTPN